MLQYIKNQADTFFVCCVLVMVFFTSVLACIAGKYAVMIAIVVSCIIAVPISLIRALLMNWAPERGSGRNRLATDFRSNLFFFWVFPCLVAYALCAFLVSP